MAQNAKIEIGCKGTTKNAHTQVKAQKVFVYLQKK
jgi:hypothetical protein